MTWTTATPRQACTTNSPHLDNPELARDIRALATRIEEQAHRYTLERRTNNLAALFTVGLAFNGMYRTHCQKCGDEGTNDGTARTCTRAWRLYSTFSPSGARLETDGARWRFTHDGAVISEGADEGAVVTAGLSSLDEARG